MKLPDDFLFYIYENDGIMKEKILNFTKGAGMDVVGAKIISWKPSEPLQNNMK